MIVAFISEDDRLIRELKGEFDFIVSDRDDLRELGGEKFYNLEHDEEKILEFFAKNDIDRGICLGYRRLFSGKFLEKCDAALYNLHPSVLPKFKGLDVYRRVLESEEDFNGATLHRIIEEMDEGEIVAQKKYQIADINDLEELKGKAKPIELSLVRNYFL